MQPTDPNQFSERVWDAILDSQEIARRFRNDHLEVEHLFLSLLAQEGRAARILEACRIDLARLEKQLETFTARQTKVMRVEQLYLGKGLDLLLDRAEEARASKQASEIAIEHVLLAFSRDDRVGRRLLRSFQVDTRVLEDVLAALRSEATQAETDAPAAETEEASDNAGAAGADAKKQEASGDKEASPLEKFGRDLTALARAGKLDPVIGRDAEIRRTIQVLSRRSKNNPVLIGEPGVGKTAIAEGLAQRIVNGDVPESLKNRQLVTLDMGSLIAGAKYRGEFEARLRGVLKQTIASEGQIVLFIDELQTVVGSGTTSGSLDAGNLLKPMLARGELRCIGATTLDEYRKHIEKDPALERRFQQVYIAEPDVAATVSILRGLKERYEVHHGVKILDSSLVAAATLSNRYIADRFLPDKAIDLVDEAAAKLKMEITSKPSELENIDRRILQLQMEELSLKAEEEERGNVSTVAVREAKDRLERIEEEIGTLKARQEELSSQWQGEKQLLEEINALKEEEEQLRLQIERAERNGELERAAELKYGRLRGLHEELADRERHFLELQANGQAMLREQVTEADVAEIVANWTGIPVARLLAGERQKLLELEGHLHQRVIGQGEAVAAVAAAIRRARAGMKDLGRPIGSFLFMGPTGVGKTELARAIAEFLFDSEEAMVRLDMSEYMEKHAVSRLVGAPPGYVGYEEGGQLTERVRRRPYSVILLDEVEKAHPDVFNILLQVLDDGRITDSQGRTVDFRNTIVIMTSNIGSASILSESGDDANYEEMRKKVLQALRSHFRPEFLNRIDDLIIFHALTRSELRQIVTIQLRRIESLLSDQKIALDITEAAKDCVVEAGYDPTYGARPLKRAIQREIENPLATKILEGTFGEGDAILIDALDERLTFASKADSEEPPEELAEEPPEAAVTVPAEAIELIEDAPVPVAPMEIEAEVVEIVEAEIVEIEATEDEDGPAAEALETAPDADREDDPTEKAATIATEPTAVSEPEAREGGNGAIAPTTAGSGASPQHC